MARLRRVALFVGVITGFALLAGHAPAVAAAAPVAPVAPVAPAVPKLMVVGDSITQGSAGDYTWRYRLYKHLVAVGVRPDLVGPRRDLFNNVTNQHGDMNYIDPAFDTDHNATWGRQLAQAEPAIEAEVRAATPDYLLVLLGINDLTWAADAPQTETYLRRFLASARKGRSTVRIVLGTVLPTAKSVAEPDFAARLADYNARLTRAAAELSTTTSPITVAATARDVNVAVDTYDGVHANARGELKLAAAFADALWNRFRLGAVYPRPLPDVPVGPRTPPKLTAEPRNGGAQLSWTESPGATGYWVWQRVADSTATFERLPWPLKISDSPWTAGLLTNGVTYEFKLQPAKFYNDGVYSNVVRVTPAEVIPGPPSDLRAVAGDRSVRLAWSAQQHATGYYVYVRDVTAGDTAFTRLPWPVTGSSWTARGLTNGSTYEYRLQSFNGYLGGGMSAVVTAHPAVPGLIVR